MTTDRSQTGLRVVLLVSSPKKCHSITKAAVPALVPGIMASTASLGPHSKGMVWSKMNGRFSSSACTDSTVTVLVPEFVTRYILPLVLNAELQGSALIGFVSAYKCFRSFSCSACFLRDSADLRCSSNCPFNASICLFATSSSFCLLLSLALFCLRVCRPETNHPANATATVTIHPMTATGLARIQDHMEFIISPLSHSAASSSGSSSMEVPGCNRASQSNR